MNRPDAIEHPAAALLLGAALLAAPAAAGPPIELVWADPYGLFPGAAREALALEITRFSETTGIDVLLSFPDLREPMTTRAPSRIQVTLRPGQARHWGIAENAMAAAIGERGASHAIFIFLPALRRTLGHSSPHFSPRELSELTRALARVIEHELVHVLAPERGHAGSGLMSRRLTRKLLLAKRIHLDLTSLVRARDGALKLARLERELAAPASD